MLLSAVFIALSEVLASITSLLVAFFFFAVSDDSVQQDSFADPPTSFSTSREYAFTKAPKNLRSMVMAIGLFTTAIS